MKEEYDTCSDNLGHSSKILNQKKDALPDLKQNYQDAHRRYQEADKARQQQERVDELKRECAWAHVIGKEHEYRGMCEDVEKQERRIPKVQQSIDAAQVG